jgi:hypothetical protein
MSASHTASFGSIFPTTSQTQSVPSTQFAPDTLTENGAPAFSSSLSANVDFFGSVCRAGKTLTPDVVDKINRLLPLMWAEDPKLALKNIVAKRDAREGAGEKAIFITCMNWLFTYHPETAYKNLEHVPFYGYWKDLLNLLCDKASGYDRPEVRNKAIVKLFADQLKTDQLTIAGITPAAMASLPPETLVSDSGSATQPNCTLAAKWAPSLGSVYDKKFKICRVLARALGLPKKGWQKQYRQLLSKMRTHLNIVEHNMCLKLWNSIKLDQVPSNAMNRYKKAFKKRMPELFDEWINRIKKGEGKVNAKMLMPHELVEHSQLSNELTQAQWNTLREHARTKGALSGVIPVCDFSGSMAGIPMDVSMALGIMISELAEEPFKDLMISFSESPHFFKFTGNSLADKVNHARSSGVSQGYNTDIIKCFTVLLQRCVTNKVSQDKMPKKVLIITDGQFDVQTTNCDKTAFQTIQIMYQEKGYTPPTLCLWNVRGNATSTPVTMHETGSMLISGWSVNILKSILEGGEFPTPYSTMITTLSDPRYDRLTV